MPSNNDASSKPWHDDIQKRVIVGTSAESEFDETFICRRCDVPFIKNDNKIRHNPDRVCPKCGQLVDVKYMKDAMNYPTITISQVPFDKWDGNILVIAKFGDEWFGQRKWRLTPEGPFQPAHTGPHSTSFYKIPRDQFFPATNYIKRKHES